MVPVLPKSRQISSQAFSFLFRQFKNGHRVVWVDLVRLFEVGLKKCERPLFGDLRQIASRRIRFIQSIHVVTGKTTNRGEQLAAFLHLG